MYIVRAAVVGTALALLAGTAPLEAQTLSVRAAAGAAVPSGGAAERRDAGPAAVISLESRVGARWSLRADGEWAVLRGPTAPAGQEHFWGYQDIRAIGVSLNGTRRLSDDRLAPYLLVGAGAYRLQRIGDTPSPYGTTGAVQAGIGLDADLWGRIAPFVEARAQAHLTDYGSREYSATVYWPLVVGLRIR